MCGGQHGAGGAGGRDQTWPGPERTPASPGLRHQSRPGNRTEHPRPTGGGGQQPSSPVRSARGPQSQGRARWGRKEGARPRGAGHQPGPWPRPAPRAGFRVRGPHTAPSASLRGTNPLFPFRGPLCVRSDPTKPRSALARPGPHLSHDSFLFTFREFQRNTAMQPRTLIFSRIYTFPLTPWLEHAFPAPQRVSILHPDGSGNERVTPRPREPTAAVRVRGPGPSPERHRPGHLSPGVCRPRSGGQKPKAKVGCSRTEVQDERRMSGEALRGLNHKRDVFRDAGDRRGGASTAGPRRP